MTFLYWCETIVQGGALIDAVLDELLLGHTPGVVQVLICYVKKNRWP